MIDRNRWRAGNTGRWRNARDDIAHYRGCCQNDIGFRVTHYRVNTFIAGAAERSRKWNRNKTGL
ncbi:Uncharacterised protein [Mycobacterium tuberculosis]|uniref:Uncharacterized protein n=2 Tax=Mycobacterium tuberculosis TaxID=1773 RepID=A0A916P703_MYCTX|nr:hypothetical protein MRGA423_24150 [Mycobacterium tuberculosis RGTB423]AGL25365.1 hypothetical protein I917_26900 [Mycobacterium tuberculosis str. Haarlem/NITR202]AIH59180.1 hypothetical protein IU12_20420 [Mycobacterium tuberculosis]COX10091.1 Uncharacterised protein [Mycobacterium tuberculosis]COX38900.1 Uncharacterised protein [Mycobacterium tuberculosis]